MFKYITVFASAVCLAILSLDLAYSQTPSVDPVVKVENADLVKGRTVTGTLKQVIGDFSSHGRPEIGDTFEINLDALPTEAIQLTPLKKGATSYMPFHAPMTITRVKQVKEATVPRRTVIELSAIDRHDKFVIRILAEDLAKGSKVRVIFYHPQDFLGSMAEAEGVLQ